MQIHYPDGTPFDPLDALNHFESRMDVARMLASTVHDYPNADLGDRIAGFLFALADDYEETKACIEDYFDRLPSEAARADIGGWGSDRPLRPRRSEQKAEEAAHG